MSSLDRLQELMETLESARQSQGQPSPRGPLFASDPQRCFDSNKYRPLKETAASLDLETKRKKANSLGKMQAMVLYGKTPVE